MDMPSRELELIAVVRELVRELAPQRLKRGDVTLSSRLDRDLGIDSLGRTELVLRIERKFRVRLAVDAVAEMDTVADLLKAVEQGAPSDLKTSGVELSTFAPETPAHRPARRREDADRDARLACREPSGSSARHGAAGREHRARHHELPRPADRGARGRTGADQPRHRAGRPHRDDAADLDRFLRVVLRHSLCRRRAGADLSARAHGAARRAHAPPDRDPAQCRRADADHRAGGAQARGAAAQPGRDAEVGRDRRDAVGGALRPCRCRAPTIPKRSG